MDSATAGTESTESADTAGSTAAPAYTRSHTMMHFLMLVATFCWAANIVAGKEALRGLGPAALAQLRALGAGLAFFLVFRAWRARPAGRAARKAT